MKKYFRILKKLHAYLQAILKTHVKFQKDRTKTLGGVKGTRSLLKIRNHAPRTTESRNGVPPLFFEKAGDNKKYHNKSTTLERSAINYCGRA